MQRKDIYADAITANIFSSNSQPTEDSHLATKAYVDSASGGGSTYELKYSGEFPLLKGEIVRILPDNVTGQAKVIKPSSVPILETFATTTGTVISKGVATDSLGNVYVTGSFAGMVTFGTTTLTSAGFNNIFVAKLNSSGVWQWAVRAGGPSNNDDGLSITVDCSGNVYITGRFFATADFGSTTLSSMGDIDIFIAKLNSSGVWQWAVKAGGTDDDQGLGIDVDCSGNVYVTGSFANTVTFETTPPTTLTSAGNNDIFVAKLSSGGSWQWVVRAGSALIDQALGINIDCNGNVYITGFFEGVANFGTLPPLTSAGISDIFVAKLNSNGSWQWAVRAGGPGVSQSISLYADYSGNVYVTGYFNGTATFGNTTLTSAVGGQDIFVAKVNSSGVWQWADKAGSTTNFNFNRGSSIIVDCFGNVYVTGNFTETVIFGTTTLTSTIDEFDSSTRDVFVAKLNSSGSWQWAIGVGGPITNTSGGVTVDRFGNVYFVDYSNTQIQILKVSPTILGVAGISKSVTVNNGEVATITFPGATGISDFSSSPLLPGYNYYIDKNSQLTSCGKCSQRFLGVAYDETVLLSGVNEC